MEFTDETTNYTQSTESITITTYETTLSPSDPPPTEVTSDNNTNGHKDDTTTVIPTTAPMPTTIPTVPTTTTTVKPTPDWNELCQELCRVGEGGKLCNCDLPPFF